MKKKREMKRPYTENKWELRHGDSESGRIQHEANEVQSQIQHEKPEQESKPLQHHPADKPAADSAPISNEGSQNKLEPGKRISHESTDTAERVFLDEPIKDVKQASKKGHPARVALLDASQQLADVKYDGKRLLFETGSMDDGIGQFQHEVSEVQPQIQHEEPQSQPLQHQIAHESPQQLAEVEQEGEQPLFEASIAEEDIEQLERESDEVQPEIQHEEPMQQSQHQPAQEPQQQFCPLQHQPAHESSQQSQSLQHKPAHKSPQQPQPQPQPLQQQSPQTSRVQPVGELAADSALICNEGSQNKLEPGKRISHNLTDIAERVLLDEPENDVKQSSIRGYQAGEGLLDAPKQLADVKQGGEWLLFENGIPEDSGEYGVGQFQHEADEVQPQIQNEESQSQPLLHQPAQQPPQISQAQPAADSAPIYNEGSQNKGKPGKRISHNLTDIVERILLDDSENDVKHASKKGYRAGVAILDASQQLADVKQGGERLLFEKGSAEDGGKDGIGQFALSKGYIAAKVAAELVPDEIRCEDSGTKAIRTLTRESAELLGILASSEKKRKRKLRHDETPTTAVITADTDTGASDAAVSPENTDTSSDMNENADNSPAANCETPSDTATPETSTAPENSDTPSENQAPSQNQPRAPQTQGTPPPPPPTTTQPHQTSETLPPENTSDAKIDHKIDKYERQAENLQDKIQKTKSKIQKPKQSKLAHAPDAHKKQLSFTDEIIPMHEAAHNKPRSNTLTANVASHAGRKISNFAHGKISEVEDLDGNTGIKAAHTAQKGMAHGYRAGKKIYRYAKNRPYRKLQHLQAKHAKAQGKLAYQKLLKENPCLRKKPLARAIQKQRIKRQYAQAARVAAKGGKAGAIFGNAAAGKLAAGAKLGVIAKTKLGVVVLAKKAIAAVVVLAGKFILLALVLALLLLTLTMCMGIFGASVAYIAEAIGYTADVDDITAYSVFMTELEVELVEDIHAAMSEPAEEVVLVINGVSNTFPPSAIIPGHGGTFINGFQVSPSIPSTVIPPIIPSITALLPLLPDISHCPFEVMAYLTVAHGDFSSTDINAVLQELFAEVFQFSYTVVDTTIPVTVPVSHWESTPDGFFPVSPTSTTQNVPYRIRTVTLQVVGTISGAIQSRLEDMGDEFYLEHFEFLMYTRGLRQFVGSPFEDDWTGAISSPFGYRFHPVYGFRHMHTGIDIAKPEGTPILGGLAGMVISAGYQSGYGNTVILEYTDEETGTTIRVLYAHMEEIDVDVGDVLELGDVIGTVGQTGTATGPHLHIEILIQPEGETTFRYINPKFFLEP